MPRPPQRVPGSGAPTSRHVLIVNQHGDNTGDEAAIRAMIAGLEDQLRPVRFTVLHQFRERSSEVEVASALRWIPLVLPVHEALRLVVHSLLRLVGVRAPRLLGPTGASIVEAYETADLVVSAPGGPYFGDPYWSHEPVHWFYVWLARLHRAPTALYAPSAGPFRIRPLNPFRRLTYRCFGVVTVREERSAEFLAELMGHGFPVEITTDSALQERVEPCDRATWLLPERFGRAPLDDRFLVVVSAIDAAYAGDPDPALRRRRYDDAVVAAIRRIVERISSEQASGGSPDGAPAVHVAFMPQLHSEEHSDVAYLTGLGEALGDAVSWEVVDDGLSSVVQRGRFAAADLVIAGRYHPAVFAVSAAVPVLCIPYEHKAAGLMEAAGMHDYVVDLDDVSTSRLVATVDALLDRRDEVRAHLRDVEPELRRRSRRTSELVAGLIA